MSEDEVKDNLSEVAMKSIEMFLTTMDIDKSFWAQYKKKEVCNFGMVTTSISEALHNKMKNGPLGIRPNMSLSLSLMKMISQSENNEKKTMLFIPMQRIEST